MPKPIDEVWPELRARFQERYDVHESGCWVWRGAERRIGVDGRHQSAMRVAWAIEHGSCAEDVIVVHRPECPRTGREYFLCVNPAHLMLGTTKTVKRNRQRRGRGPSRIAHPASDGTALKPSHVMPKGWNSPMKRIERLETRLRGLEQRLASDAERATDG